MGIKLKEAGFEDFVLLEKGDGVGGTWRHNQYPGCACDIPSLLYSFSFEMKKDWSRPYAPQGEILEYMESCAEKYGILPHCRFGSGVKSATWDEEHAVWNLDLESGSSIEADVVVSAIGMFNELNYPDVEGLDSFEGHHFHSARWDWNHDLSGKRVGVIGSAASAVQFVPEIAKEAEQVYLFQRTANWVMPKDDDPHTEEILQVLENDPTAATSLRDMIYEGVDGGLTFSDPVAVGELEDSVLAAIEVIEDPELREKMKPQHPHRQPAIRQHPGELLGAACIIDRSNGTADVGVPLVSLCKLDVPAYPADALPPELAALPPVKPGSRGLAA